MSKRKSNIVVGSFDPFYFLNNSYNPCVGVISDFSTFPVSSYYIHHDLKTGTYSFCSFSRGFNYSFTGYSDLSVVINFLSCSVFGSSISTEVF